MNVPKLRFKEFDGEWEESKLSNLLEKIEEKATDSTKGIVLTSSRNGLFPRSEYFNGREEKDTEGYSLVPKNTFTYRQMSDDNTFHINYNTKYELGLVSPEYPVFKTTTLLTDDYFLNYINNSPRFKKHCMLQKKGGTRTRLYFKVLSELVIAKPSVEEQQKIGRFFDLLNKKIQLQQQKIDLLQEQKKGFLQKMFPKVGETVPELRFDGFTDEWEQSKLGDILKVSKEKNKTNIWNKNQVLSVSRELGTINQIEYQGRSFAGTDISGYKVVHVGQMIYTKSPLKGAPYGIFQNVSINGIVSPLYAVYNSTGKALAEFIGLQLKNDNIATHYLTPLVSKGAKNTINITDEGALGGNVYIPSLSEQQKLIEFFKQLDDTIALYQRKLEIYKEQKKGFMQQMFI